VPGIGTTVTLTTNWTRYTIDLTGKDLSYILGGFAWVCTARDNPSGAVFWIDDIQYNKPQLNEPRFIRSYVTLAGTSFDGVHHDIALAADNAMAMLAMMANGREDDWRRARLIADAFVYAQAHDVTYSDGRLRNAYEAGKLVLPPGWTPNGKSGAVHLPLIVNCAAGTVGLDRIQVSSYTGNVTLAGIALLTYFQKMGGAQYLEAARRIGEWVEGRRENRGFGGYRGGFEGFDQPSPEFPNDPVEVPWATTEHNLAALVLFNKLFQATGEPAWKNRANHAQSFIEKMWDPGIGCLLAGAKDPQTLNRDLLTLTVQPWSVLAMQDALTRFPNILQCAESRYRTRKDGFNGYDYDTDKDGGWFEGTAYVGLAYQRAANPAMAEDVLGVLRDAQASALNSNRLGLVAASHDGVTTGLFTPNQEPVLLFSRLHVGASSWYALAELARNPFALFGFGSPRITGLSLKGKKLVVTGEGFGEGAVIFLNGEAQTTLIDSSNRTTRLIGKKAGKRIKPHDKVKVRNGDGSESNEGRSARGRIKRRGPIPVSRRSVKSASGCGPLSQRGRAAADDRR
jgi:hypothetical protein